MLLEILWCGGAGPVHEIQINVVDLEIFERRCNALLDTLVPWVVELGRDPDLLTRDTRLLHECFDAVTNFVLVTVR
jgi:hypothetical protein